ncbi:MAG: protein kinase [Deltaproteobacteria bacterium]
MDFDRLNDLFDRAVALPPAERGTLLAEARAEDPELGEQLSALLAADASVEDGFLALTVSETDSGVPEQIGPYRVTREIGRGGMGVVYEAEQEQPRRRVAVKVVGGLASPELLRRFEREARALAQLQHVGIAHIYDAGTAKIGGQTCPYFAMEYLDGVRIDRYAERLGTRQRLELFAQVCDAVHHAHQRGIVHRDLKPANVIVVEGGQPKVLDFGVARVTGQDAMSTVQTQTGQIVGTVGYMSPEQVGGSSTIDARADVWALGVMLFELLAGRLPFELSNKPLAEVARVVRDEEPTRIGSIDDALRGDVETIIDKALEKDVERRYATAAALGADVRRHLSNEPIVARAPSTWYQVTKFARRHRGLVFGTAATIFALVFGLVGTALSLVEANRERDAKDRALRVSAAVTQFLTDALEQADPRHGRRDITLYEVLDDAEASVAERFAEQSEIEAELRLTIGWTFHGLSELERAEVQLERAHALLAEHRGEADESTLVALQRLARTKTRLSKGAEAMRAVERVLELRRANGTLDGRRHVAMLGLWAWAAVKAGRLDDAERRYEEALATPFARANPTDEVVMEARGNFGVLLLRLGETERARAHFQVTYDHFLEVYGEEHPSSLSALSSLGVAVRRTNPEAALPLLSRAMEVSARVNGPAHYSTLGDSNHYAKALLALGRHDEALASIDETIAVAGDEAPPFLYLARAQILAAKGAPEALEAMRAVVATYVAKHGLQSDGTYFAFRAFVELLVERRAHAEARREGRRILDVLETRLPPGHKRRVEIEALLERAGSED